MTDQEKRRARIRRALTWWRFGFATVILVPFVVWFFDQSMIDNPSRIHWYYRASLDRYGNRLELGDVQFVEGRGFAIPQFLIEHGATSTSQNGECFIIWFSSILDNPTPALIYSPRGYNPTPPELEKLAREPKSRWQVLSEKWCTCQWPWWINN